MKSNTDKNAQTFALNIDQAKKINRLMPKGYKVISVDDFKKRLNQSKKKSKVLYQPIAQVLAPPQPRKAKRQKNYYEGQEDPIEPKCTVHYDLDRSQQEPWKKRQVERPPKQQISFYEQPPIRQKSVVSAEIPNIVPQTIYAQSKNSYVPKQLIEQLQRHPKFNIINVFQQQYPEKCNYRSILQKLTYSSYYLQEIMADMQKLFIKIYSQYPRKSEMYASATQLQGYLHKIINSQKNKPNEEVSEKLPILNIDYSISPILPAQQELLTPELSRQMTQNKKKTIPIKPDLKNITIMDKRLLGQNIKKLPPDYLQQICKIVFETIETRQEYVIDIDTLPLKKVKQLQIFVNTCIQKLGEFEIQNQDKNDDDSSESSFIITDDDD